MTDPLGSLAPLGGARFGRVANVVLLGETASTNDVARALIERMVAEDTDLLPTCVAARRQTAGKGRAGRSWSTIGEGAVAVSLVAPWPEGPGRIRVPVTAGIRLARALSAAWGVELRLKWPNDLFCRGKKLAGILVEGRALPEGAGYVVVGVGLNVFTTRAELDSLGLSAATSLALEGVDATLLRGDLPLVAVLSALDETLEGEIDDLPAAFAAVTLHREGDPLEVRDGERIVAGRYRGLTPDGLLRLETDDGVAELISGDVTRF